MALTVKWGHSWNDTNTTPFPQPNYEITTYELKIKELQEWYENKKESLVPSTEDILVRALEMFLQEGTTLEQAKNIARHALRKTGYDVEGWGEDDDEWDDDDELPF